MIRRLVFLVLMTAIAAHLGCVHKGGPPPKPGPDDRPDPSTQPYFLVDLTIDRANVRDGAALLFDEPPAGEQYGESRRVRGYITLADNDFCRAEVRVAETGVGLGGRKSERRYDLLNFFGTVDGARTRAQAKAEHTPSFDGRVTELRISWVADNEVEVRPWIGNRPQAYVYRFQRKSLKDHDVAMPH